MQTDYSEYDTERARAAERSSAGRATQQLTAPSPGPTLRSPRPFALAFIMIGLGVLLLSQTFLGRGDIAGWLFGSSFLPDEGELQGGLVLLTIGSCFLFFSFWKRVYLLLIPGCILTGLSVGVTLADLTEGVSVLWGLSAGFFAILGISRALFRIRSQLALWPAIPGTVLLGVGAIVAASNLNLPFIFSGWFLSVPLLLIGAGLYLGWGRRALE